MFLTCILFMFAMAVEVSLSCLMKAKRDSHTIRLPTNNTVHSFLFVGNLFSWHTDQMQTLYGTMEHDTILQNNCHRRKKASITIFREHTHTHTLSLSLSLSPPPPIQGNKFTKQNCYYSQKRKTNETTTAACKFCRLSSFCLLADASRTKTHQLTWRGQPQR